MQASIRLGVFVGGCGLLYGCAAGVSLPASADTAVGETTPDAATEAPLPNEERRDAATPDRKPSDGKGPSNSGFPQVNCASDLLFCEDFEGGAAGKLDPARWMTWLEGATASFDKSRVHGGSYAFHVKKTDPVTTGGYISTIKTFPIAGSDFNVRFFFYMDKVTPNRWWTALWLGGYRSPMAYTLSPTPVDETKPANNTVMVQYLFGSPGEIVKSEGLAPSERWVCYEVEYRRASGLHYYVDEKELPGLRIPLGPDAPAFDGELKFGVTSSHEDVNPHTDGFNVWIDDIAVSTHRIGCNP